MAVICFNRLQLQILTSQNYCRKTNEHNAFKKPDSLRSHHNIISQSKGKERASVFSEQSVASQANSGCAIKWRLAVKEHWIRRAWQTLVMVKLTHNRRLLGNMHTKLPKQWKPFINYWNTIIAILWHSPFFKHWRWSVQIFRIQVLMSEIEDINSPRIRTLAMAGQQSGPGSEGGAAS